MSAARSSSSIPVAFRWTDAEVRRALDELLLAPRPPGGAVDQAPSGEGPGPFSAISTDSRSVGQGALFVALVGERFDGHDFVDAAARAGATGVVVSRDVAVPGGVAAYRVEDTLDALGALARHLRRARSWTVVGITGSSGKTTVKELTRSAVAGHRRVHANPGNFNNRVGLPLSVLGAPEESEVLLLEMGTNEPGEIGILTRVAEPDVGVVITVGDAHLEGLGSREGVLREKLDLIRGLPEGAVAVVGDEPPELPEAAREMRPAVRVAGWSPRADRDLRPGDPTPFEGAAYRFRWRECEVRLRIPGRVAVTDALIALAVAGALGVPDELAAEGVSGTGAPEMRGEVRRVGAFTVLVDCYNANPQSTRAALDLLRELPADGDRVAVLGSMLELGPGEGALHREILQEARLGGIDLVVATGLFAREAGAGADDPALLVLPDPVDGWERLSARLTGRETVLLKGSRGTRLERLLPLLERDFGGVG